MKPRVLCVDDDPDVLEGLALGLRRTADVHTASCVAEALQHLSDKRPYWVVLTDVNLPGMSGAQLLSLLKKRSPLTQRILLTGAANLELALNAINSGEVYRFLTKPCSQEAIRESVTSAAQTYAQHATEREARFETSRGTLQALLELCTDFDKRATGRAFRFRARAMAVAATLRSQVEELELAALAYGLIQSLSFAERPRELLETLLVRLAHTSSLLRSALVLLREAKPSLFDGIDLPHIALPAHSADATAVNLLRALCDLDAIELTTANTNAAMDRLLRAGTTYSRQVIQAIYDSSLSTKDARSVSLIALESGMILANDVRMKDGSLLLAKDTVLTEAVLHRLLEYREPQLAQPVHVWPTA